MFIKNNNLWPLLYFVIKFNTENTIIFIFLKGTIMKYFLPFFLLFTLFSLPKIYPQDPLIQSIIEQTNADSIMHFVRELSGEVPTIIGGASYTIISRHKNQPSNDKAADYIKQKLENYGLTVYDQWFSGSGRNVYGVKPGTKYPNQKYIICAHYDDMPSGSIAPGADDNASGTAAVIENTKVYREIGSNFDIGAVAIVGAIELAPGDFLELWAERDSGNGDLEVVSMNLVAN